MPVHEASSSNLPSVFRVSGVLCDSCRYHALLATRFAMKEPAYQECFEDCFRRQYTMIHRLETNKLRNVAKFFAALLEQDAISWAVMDTIRLTQDDTTSSSRIFIKILFQVRSASFPWPALCAACNLAAFLC